jgi:hypothetical protein
MTCPNCTNATQAKRQAIHAAMKWVEAHVIAWTRVPRSCGLGRSASREMGRKCAGRGWKSMQRAMQRERERNE